MGRRRPGAPERNASDEALEVSGVEKSGASCILLVFLEYGFQHRLVATLEGLEDAL